MNLQIQSTKRPGRQHGSVAVPSKGKVVTKAFNVPVILHTLCEDGAMSAQYDGDVRRQRERMKLPVRATYREEVVVSEPSIYLG